MWIVKGPGTVHQVSWELEQSFWDVISRTFGSMDLSGARRIGQETGLGFRLEKTRLAGFVTSHGSYKPGSMSPLLYRSLKRDSWQK